MAGKMRNDEYQIDKLTHTQAEQEHLQNLCDILHLFHHRNRNQHRRSVWWRHFSNFRRQVNIVTADIITLNEKPLSHVDRARKKGRDSEISIQISQRLGFWQTTLVAKWQNAFSQLLADGRFATLGIVLVATLAQVCQIVGITAAFEDLGQVEVEKVLYDFGQENWQDDAYSGSDSVSRSEDFGQIVARPDSPDASTLGLQNVSRGTPSSKLRFSEANRTGTASPGSSIRVQQPRKKRKTGNAIDNLFEGLG